MKRRENTERDQRKIDYWLNTHALSTLLIRITITSRIRANRLEQVKRHEPKTMTTKRNYLWSALCFTCLALLAPGASLGATEKTGDDEKKSGGEITRTTDVSEPEGTAKHPRGKDVTVTATEIKFPGVTINRETHEVRMDASVCLDRGILEYVVCLTGTFDHESIFETKVKPEMLHTALLLTGFEPTPMIPGLEEAWYSEALEAEKSRVGIDVEWEIDGRVQRVNITSMIRNNTGNDNGVVYYETPYPQDEPEEVSDAWVFSGSFVGAQGDGRRVYGTDRSGIVIGIWRNSSAVIQYAKPTRNPYRGKNSGMAVNEDYVPNLGTPVKLVFYKYDPLESFFEDD
jgi:hypothetical protein